MAKANFCQFRLTSVVTVLYPRETVFSRKPALRSFPGQQFNILLMGSQSDTNEKNPEGPGSCPFLPGSSGLGPFRRYLVFTSLNVSP